MSLQKKKKVSCERDPFLIRFPRFILFISTNILRSLPKRSIALQFVLPFFVTAGCYVFQKKKTLTIFIVHGSVSNVTHQIKSQIFTLK